MLTNEKRAHDLAILTIQSKYLLELKHADEHDIVIDFGQEYLSEYESLLKFINSEFPTSR